MGQPIIVNAIVLEKCTTVRTALNADSLLYLYLQDADLGYDQVFEDMTLPTYGGFAPIDLSGLWSAVAQAADGIYYTEIPEQVFPAPTSGGPETVRGFFLLEGDDMFGGGRLSGAMVMMVGGLPLSIQIRYTEYDKEALLAVVGP